MKVWILHERLIDLDTADNYAKKGFDAQLQAFYEEYGLLQARKILLLLSL